mgnify:CR=1 FL=1|tara:strand:- start:236 stop:787 length:552 start_codon:yes stop_codon:yes gene_type:complete
MAGFMNITLWTSSIKYLLLSFIIISVQILPLPIVQQEILWPDLIFLFSVGWLLRKPDQLPIMVIYLVHLISDIVLLRPIGLWSGLSLIVFVFVKWRIYKTKAIFQIGQELIFVMALLALVLITNLILQYMFKILNPPITMIMLQMTFSLLIYPLVMGILHYILGVRYGKHEDNIIGSRRGSEI